MEAVTARLHPVASPSVPPATISPGFIAPGPREGCGGCVSPFAVASRALMKMRVCFSLHVETHQRTHAVRGITQTESIVGTAVSVTFADLPSWVMEM